MTLLSLASKLLDALKIVQSALNFVWLHAFDFLGRRPEKLLTLLFKECQEELFRESQ